jgi:hypothetical protein
VEIPDYFVLYSMEKRDKTRAMEVYMAFIGKSFGSWVKIAKLFSGPTPGICSDL